MNYEDNPTSIKYHLKKYLINNQERFKNKHIIDFPAGNGVTSRIIKKIGSTPLAFDLFPEYFQLDDIECKRANISDGIPVEDEIADIIICQEGIEHFSDQLSAFKEFNRVLKQNGILIITTPNYSNLRAKLSYLLSESERFNSKMPPNEIDSIWMSKQDITKDIYFGHIFLIGIQKLRLFGKLSGFTIKNIQFTRIKTTSLLLLPLFYPFIFLSNLLTYFKNLKKKRNTQNDIIKGIYKEIFLLSINPKILVDGHLFIEYEKIMDHNDVANKLSGIHKNFGTT